MTTREIEEGILKLEEEKKAVEERKTQVEEPVNCMMPIIEPESLASKQGGVSDCKYWGCSHSVGYLQCWDGEA